MERLYEVFKVISSACARARSVILPVFAAERASAWRVHARVRARGGGLRRGGALACGARARDALIAPRARCCVASRRRDDDGLIDKGEFELALGLKSSLFVNRVFTIFDQNLDNNITFEEFVIGLSTFSARASREAKASMSFRIHDIDGDGIISRADLSKMLSATIAENALHISEEQFNALIATTFEQAGAADKHGLTLDDFLSLAKQRPAMLSNMTIASISVSR